MPTDRPKVLADYTDDELLAEIQRRRDEAQRRIDKLSLASELGNKFVKKSEAKRLYWEAWHEYRAVHPNATLAEWRKSQKRGAKRS